MKRILLPILVFSVVFLSLKVIDGLRAERGSRREEVVQNITQSAGGAVELVTPVLVVDITETFPVKETRTREVVKQGVVVRESYDELLTSSQTRTMWLIPSDEELVASSHVETRFIGIFPGRVQTAQVRVSGHVKVPSHVLAARHQGGETKLSAAHLDVSMLSLRSLGQMTRAQWQGTPLHFEPAVAGAPGFETASAPVPLATLAGENEVAFDLALSLRGGSSFTLHPLAESSTVQLDADWPHADFTLHGRTSALPNQRAITDSTTHAEWQMSGLSSGLKAVYDFSNPNDERHFEHGLSATVGADYIEPIDVFARLERSVKYGVLLIGLSLSLLWLMIVRSKVQAHVMQYTLIAINLALFFLLLLSLAEKVDFLYAYAISALAVTTLNVVYLSGVMGGFLKALFGTLPSAISFVALYFLLVSEDSALLLGSLFVFVVLGGLMVFTRKLDWATVMKSQPTTSAP